MCRGRGQAEVGFRDIFWKPPTVAPQVAARGAFCCLRLFGLLAARDHLFGEPLPFTGKL